MESIEDRAENLYSEELRYHNFDHILEVLETAMDFIWACFGFGIEVDVQVVYYSILFHDAGFHEDHTDKGFDTKEEYSAYLAEEVLSDYDFSSDFINWVKQCIVGTHLDSDLKTIEEKIVRAADIYNLSGDYQDFIDKNITLKLETEERRGEELEWSKWKDMCEGIIKEYLDQELVVGDDFELMSMEDARSNLNKFLNEDESKLESRKEILFPDK